MTDAAGGPPSRTDPEAGSRSTAGPEALGAPVAIPRDLAATLVLVRHGESTWVAEGRFQGISDPPLSPLGERQAALAADRLAHPLAYPALPVPEGAPLACWHSPLRRAASTAAAIAARWIPPVELLADPRLAEIGQGTWEGLTMAEVLARDPEILDGWRRDPVRHHAPGGETLQGAAGRASSFVADLLGELARGRGSDDRGSAPWALLVAHGGVFRVLLLALLDLPLDAFWAFPFALCGISVIDVRHGRAALRTHNVVEHLAALDATAAEAIPAAERTGAL